MANRDERSLNYNLCIICQDERKESLVENPVAHERLLSFVKQRCECGDLWSFPQLLADITADEIRASKATWHRKCFQEATHVEKLKRIKEKSERGGDGSTPKRQKADFPEKTFTRSQTSPYDREKCFFCEEGAGYCNNLHSVSTSSAGKSIRSVVEITGNVKLLTKLSTAISTDDAHAIDIKYHSKCYTNNVGNVLRHANSDSTDQSNVEVAARLEFIDITERALNEGKTLKMAELESLYKSVLQENDVQNPRCSWKSLKRLITNEIANVDFMSQNVKTSQNE